MMRKALIFILLLLFVAAYTGCGADRAQTPSPRDTAEDAVKMFPARVIRVVDGDTLRVRMENGKEENVRFIGVDTPENTREAEPFGKEAAAYTQERLDGKTVYLELDVDERDEYGRILAYIWLAPPENGSEAEVRTKMFNADLLLGGYARVMTVPPNVRYAELFVKLQREARQAGKGLWGGGCRRQCDRFPGEALGLPLK